MRVVKVWFLLLVLVVLTAGCLSETGTIETTPAPDPTTTQPTITTSTTSSTTSSSTITTTTTSTTTTLQTAEDYASGKLGGQYGQKFSGLGPLDGQDKAFIDQLARIPSSNLVDAMLGITNNEMLEDGAISEDERLFAQWSAQNPERIRAISGLLENDLYPYMKGLEESDPDLFQKVLKAIQPYGDAYPSKFSFDFLNKYLEGNVSDEYLASVVKDDGVDWKTESQKILEYIDASKNPEFSKLSLEVQKFIMGTEWFGDKSNWNYFSKIPGDFDPENKVKDSDSGDVEDYYEIKGKGDINNPKDDINSARFSDKLIINMPMKISDITSQLIYKFGPVDRFHPEGRSGLGIKVDPNSNLYAPTWGKVINIEKGTSSDFPNHYQVYISLYDGHIAAIGHLIDIKVNNGAKVDINTVLGKPDPAYGSIHFSIQKQGGYVECPIKFLSTPNYMELEERIKKAPTSLCTKDGFYVR